MLLGAGVSVLGPIEIGPGSKVGAGSVVVTDLPCHCVAVGVPARIIRQSCVEEPCVNMDLVSPQALPAVMQGNELPSALMLWLITKVRQALH